MMTSDGQILHERYRVLSRLGAGGMGSVWLAEDQLLERRVALKELVPHPRTSGLAESRARALVEARAMARVRHRSIVRIHDIFFVGEDPWIVMEYISGRSLADMIRGKRLDERDVAAIGMSVLQGLRAVHAARIVHRDIKPANILADADGSVFLVDFGIAKIAGDMPLTSQSKIVGTTEYMAPERLLGKPATPASDLWSLGVTLYYALEGCCPFAGEDLHSVITAILNKDPVAPVRNGRLADILLRLVCKEPSERPHAADVIGMLEPIIRRQEPDNLCSPPAKSSVPAGTQAYPRFYNTELSRREMADAISVLNKSSTDSGIDTLLGKSDVKIANIIANSSLDVAAELMATIATTQPGRAGRILQTLSASRSGKILDYVSHATATVIVDALPADDAVRILSRCDARTAADVIMDLPSSKSGRLIEAMSVDRAVVVLGYARPTSVAAILGTMSQWLSSKLLVGFGPDFRALVVRHM
jgi:eukaryotic-like serine/threonine-protein kinase